MEKYKKLEKLAKTVQAIDGDFALFMRFIDNDSDLRFIGATEIVLAWSRARNELCGDGKEISIIYG